MKDFLEIYKETGCGFRIGFKYKTLEDKVFELVEKYESEEDVFLKFEEIKHEKEFNYEVKLQEFLDMISKDFRDILNR